MWRLICLVGPCVLLPACGCSESSTETAVPPVRTADVATSSSPSGVADSGGLSTDSADGLPQNSNSAGSLPAVQQAFDGMKFNVPPSWKQLPLSSMQMGIVAAKFGMPEIDDQISLTLSTSGGSVEDNISRWQGQFSGGEPMTQESLTIDGQEAALVSLKGTFAAGFGRSPEAGWRMIGVIIPMTEHNYFIKLTGPEQSVAEAESEFLAFCRSARRE